MGKKRKVVIQVSNKDQQDVENNHLETLIQDKNAAKICDVVLEAQMNQSYHEKCIKEMKKLYNQISHEEFMKFAIHFIKYAMKHDHNNPFTDTQLKFWAKFLTSFDNGDETHPALHKIFNWLLDTTSNDHYLRFRICQFVNTLFSAFGVDAQLDDDICENIQKCMIERLRDMNAQVRQQAVYALQRLQDPDDMENPVIKCYLFHMESDPNPKVRMSVITSIAKTVKTIPFLIGRLWDTEEQVRRHTFLQISRYPAKSYKVAQRIKILDQGLNDHSENVRKVVTTIMLPQWFEAYQRDFQAFLSAMKFDATVEDFAKFKKLSIQTLKEIFKKCKPHEFIEPLKLSTEEGMEKCIPFEHLTVETIVLWQAAIKYLEETDVEDVDTILPDLKDMAVYLRNFVASTDLNPDDRVETMNFQFVLLSLLEIINGNNFGDEIGRQALQPVLFQILKTADVDECCIKIIIQCLETLIPNTDKRLQQLVDLIYSITDQTLNINLFQTTKIMDKHFENSPNPELSTQFAKLKHEIMDMTEERDNARDSGDYLTAQKLQTALDQKIEEYKNLIKPIFDSSSDESVISLGNTLYKRQRLSVEVISKCLHISFHMAASKQVEKLTLNVIELYKKFVCIYLQSQEIGIRCLALRCTTCYGLLYDILAKEVFDHVLKQIQNTPNPKIWRMAIECIFELLDFYGLQYFEVDVANNKNRKGRTLFNNMADEEEEPTNIKDNLVGFMAHTLDHITDHQICSAIIVGLCRLILHKHISSVETVVKLLLKYFNPATSDEVMQILGIFFKNLVDRRMQELLQKALFPTLSAIMDAPAESPLQDVDATKLIRFIINSTKPEFCPPGLNIHNTIALSFFSILKDETDSNMDIAKVFVTEMINLEISDDTNLRNDFKNCVDTLVPEIKDPKLVKALIQFKEMISTATTSGRLFTESQSTVVEEGSDDERAETNDSEKDLSQIPSLQQVPDDTVFKIPPARQKPVDTFVPKPVAESSVASDITTLTNDSSVTDGNEESQEINIETVDNRLNALDVNLSFSKADESEVSIVESETSTLADIPKSLPKEITGDDIVVQSKSVKGNKREHPVHSPTSVISPARKVSKKMPVAQDVQVPIVRRTTRKAIAETAEQISKLNCNESQARALAKSPEKGSKKSATKSALKVVTRNEKNELSLPTESSESVSPSKRIRKPTEKAKALEKDIRPLRSIKSTGNISGDLSKSSNSTSGRQFANKSLTVPEPRTLRTSTNSIKSPAKKIKSTENSTATPVDRSPSTSAKSITRSSSKSTETSKVIESSPSTPLKVTESKQVSDKNTPKTPKTTKFKSSENSPGIVHPSPTSVINTRSMQRILRSKVASAKKTK